MANKRYKDVMGLVWSTIAGKSGSAAASRSRADAMKRANKWANIVKQALETEVRAHPGMSHVAYPTVYPAVKSNAVAYARVNYLSYPSPRSWLRIITDRADYYASKGDLATAQMYRQMSLGWNMPMIYEFGYDADPGKFPFSLLPSGYAHLDAANTMEKVVNRLQGQAAADDVTLTVKYT